jgi:transposase
MPCNDIELLYDCIKNKPVQLRKRAAGILATYKGISHAIITKYILISKTSLYYNYKRYISNGIDQIVSNKREVFSKYNDKEHIGKLFSMLLFSIQH